MKSLLKLGLLLLFSLMCGAKREEKMVRQPAVAGSFYPADKDSLSKMIDNLLAGVPKLKRKGEVIGVVVPHAGYPYSGGTAAYTFSYISKMPLKTVILVGPSHYIYFKGIAVYGEGKWKTPLGEVEVDSALAHKIIEQNPIIRDEPEAHTREHSLEVEVPFLQKVLRNFRIVPIMMGDQDYKTCEVLAHAIVEAVRGREDILLLASSDLYHGYSYEECNRIDKKTLSFIEKFDPEGLSKALEKREAQACGGGPIVAVMLASKLLGADKGKVLFHTNSNDVTGQRGGYVVGYSACLFYKTQSEGLNEREKKELLKIARASIEKRVKGERLPEFTPLTERLKIPQGVFVTIKENHQLRGCIGYIAPVKPLYKAVSEMAIAAATSDPRFPPLQSSELKRISIEITVLSPLKRIEDPKEIEVGKHGIVIKRGPYQGLLLPQVATEEGWDRQTFLAHTCLKAGLPSDAWKEKGTEIYIFTGEVFGE